MSQLAQARRACTRLAADADAEALHDFRVAIRRLRSTLRAWKKPLQGTVKRRYRRELRKLQCATGRTRDAEVALAWLGRQDDLDAPHGEGATWLGNELQQRLESERRRACEALPASFRAIREELENRLAARTPAPPTDEHASGLSYGQALARRVRKHGRAWLKALSRLTDADDVAEAHATRIRGKRLRYLLEPAAGEVSDADALLPHLHAWQNLLGKLNDTRTLLAETSREARQAREAGRSEYAGLREIRRRLRRRQRALFKRVHERASPVRLRAVKRAWQATVERLAHSEGCA